MTEPTPAPPPVAPISRARLALIIVPLVVMVVAAWVGDALLAQLVDRHPLWLIALNARNRNLVLVTNNLDAWSYYTVGSLRLLASDPLFFALGFLYGDRAVQWLERRSSTFGAIVRSWEDLFRRASYPLVFIAPNNFICLFAGSAGMRPGVFAVLNVSGTFARLYLIRVLGETFSSPIDAVLGFIQDYRLPLTLLGIGIVAVTIVRDRRAGQGDLEALAHLEEELEAGAADGDGSDPAGGGAPTPDQDGEPDD